MRFWVKLVPSWLGSRQLGAVVLLAAGLLLAAALALGSPGGALAAGATYGPNCPDFSTFRSDVQAVGNGESATFTFDTSNACTYDKSVLASVATITIQAGANVTINGNHKLTIAGGTVNSPGDFDPFDVQAGGTLTLNDSILRYGRYGIGGPLAVDGVATIELNGSTIEGFSRFGIASEEIDLTANRSVINSNGSGGVYAHAGNINVINSTFDDNGNMAIYVIHGSGTVSVTAIGSTFTNNNSAIFVDNEGDVVVRDSTITGNRSFGIGVHHGDLTIERSIIRGNLGEGAATWEGTFKVIDSTISDNDGPGLYIHKQKGDDVEYGDVSVVVTDSAITGNGAAGVYFKNVDDVTLGDDLTLRNSVVSGNGEQGISDDSGNLSIIDSTVAGNHLAGVYTAEGDINVINSTISDNLASGVLAGEGSATVTSSTISGNGTFDSDSAGIDTSAGATLTATILASNLSANCAGAVTDNGYNLSTDASCNLGVMGSRDGVTESQLNLRPLSDNYGPLVGAPGAQQVLQTRMPGSGSIAIDQIPSAVCSTYTYPDGSALNSDERGVARPQGLGCDIGAAEVANRIALLPGSTTTVHRGCWAMLRIKALGPNGQNSSARNLPVSSVELVSPDGQTIPFAHPFRFGRFAGSPGYQLSINTRNLARGTWTLQMKIGSDPQLYAVRLTVI